MRLIVTEKGAMIDEVVIDHEAIFMGSSDSCRLHLPDARIAEQQAVIYPDTDGGWILEQLNRRNPLHVNGATIEGKASLRTGDEIQIHDYLIRAYPEYVADAARSAPQVSTSVAQLTRFAKYTLPPGTIVKKSDENIEVRAEHLQRVGAMNVHFGQCTTVEQLMNVVLPAAFENFTAQRIWIGIRRVNYGKMEFIEGRTLTGQTADLPEVGSNLQPRVLDRAQYMMLPRVSPQDTNSVMAGPLSGPEGTLGMLYVDSGAEGRRFEVQDLDFFILVANLVGAQLHAIFTDIAKNRQATMEGQVIVAHEIQARVTPRKLPQWDTLQFGAFREPGREHAGDVYDALKLSNNMAGIMVAHTRAGGAMPSMLMAQIQAAFRDSSMHLDSPHVFLRCMNWLLYDGEPDHPLDCFVSIIDPASGAMRYCVAGWMGVYIIGNRGEERSLMPAEPLPSLGVSRNVPFTHMPEQLESGETLVVFTPGVTTARNRAGETFGEDRFVNLLCDGFGQLASSMLKEMLSDLRNFTEGGQRPNDVTVLLAHNV